VSHANSAQRGAYEARLRDAIMAAGPLLDARTLPVTVRSAAIEKALAAGLPGLREDAWRYADLRFLGSAPLAPGAPGSRSTGGAPSLPARIPGFTRLVFVNGRLDTALADPCPALALQSPALVPQRTAHERFGWLNDAFATDVARLVVNARSVTDRGNIEVVFLADPAAPTQAIYPRLEVTVTEGASLTLVERHIGSMPGGMINSAVQVYAGPNSQIHHLRWQDHSHDARFLDTLQIALDRDARYQLAQLQLGSHSARSSVRAALFGAGAGLSVCAVSFASRKCTLDSSVLIDHLAPRTTSTQVLRALAREGAHLAFTSRVEITAGAAGASSQQSLKGLVDGSGAEIDLRPQLEILTDDVRASHGATTGALDENTLFYLLSRGLDRTTARNLLEWAFIEDAVKLIGNSALRREVELSIVDQLGNAAAREALQ
jgi:Fe-S cluster assembly protein SufD